MVTPNRRRQAVGELETTFGVSQRRACKVVGQPRSTQRLAAPVPSPEEQLIREWLRAFAKRRPRWGWRRAAKGLRREGWQINDKKVRRLWRDEGLRVPTKRRKKRLTGVGARVGAMSPICPNALWANRGPLSVSPRQFRRLRSSRSASGFGRLRIADPGGVGAAPRKACAARAGKSMTRRSAACGVTRASEFRRNVARNDWSGSEHVSGQCR
jgi:hypothetical protein